MHTMEVFSEYCIHVHSKMFTTGSVTIDNLNMNDMSYNLAYMPTHFNS